MTEHPPTETLRRFADGLLQPDDMALVAIHVAGCERCRDRAHREQTPRSPYAGAIQSVARRAAKRETRFRQEEHRAPGDLARILALPTEEWNRAVRSSPRYHSYAFARHTLAASKAEWMDDPHRAERMAELGLFVADRLSNAGHGRRNLNDLRSKAWAYIGNCRRIQGRYGAVPDALETATTLHHAGTGNGRDRMALVSFLRSFLSATSRFDQAQELISELEAMARHYDDRHVRPRIPWSRALIARQQGQMDLAVEELKHALDPTQGLVDEHARIQLTYSLATTLTDAGKPQRALELLRSIGRDELRCLGRRDLVEVRWSWALTRWSLGDLSFALRQFRLLSGPLLADRSPVHAAFAQVDLARVLLELGETESARSSAFKAFPTLAINSLHRASLDALDLFRRAGGLS